MMRVFNAVVHRGWWAVMATVACVAGMLGVIPGHAAAAAAVHTSKMAVRATASAPETDASPPASTQPVAVPSLTTAFSNTVQLPNGSFELQSSALPLNYQTGNGWQPINNMNVLI